MQITKMRDKDLPEVLYLAEQLGYPNKIEDFQSRYKEITESSDYALFVAITDIGKIIGYIQINREPLTLLAGPRAEVAGLIVDKSERSKGIGTALLKHAENWAKENQLPLIRIRSNVKREDAHRFYKRNGCEIKKSWHLFVKNL